VREEMQTTREAKLSNNSRQTVALGRPGIVQSSKCSMTTQVKVPAS